MRAAGFAGLALFVCTTLVSLPALAQVELSGEWSQRYHEDQVERVPGGELGDFTGIPLNDAARLRADTWDAALYGLVEWQCRPHGATYMWRSVHPVHIWKDVEPVTGETIAIHANFQDLLERVVYMDGRPHPPEEAPHTWAGFSTGKWEGDILTVTTTHLKEYYFRRDGIPMSDRATMTEHWIRHGDYLTIVQIVTDPVYLTEPFIRSTDYQLDRNQQIPPYPCDTVEEVSDRPKGTIPHHLPGTNKFLYEFADRLGIPHIAVRGGAETMYPEFRLRLANAGK